MNDRQAAAEAFGLTNCPGPGNGICARAAGPCSRGILALSMTVPREYNVMISGRHSHRNR